MYTIVSFKCVRGVNDFIFRTKKMVLRFPFGKRLYIVEVGIYLFILSEFVFTFGKHCLHLQSCALVLEFAHF